MHEEPLGVPGTIRAPLTPEQEAKREEDRAFFADFYRRLERSTPTKPRTREQDQAWRERANVKRRLRALGERLDTLAANLEQVHTDGVCPWAPPLLPLFPELWDSKAPRVPGIADRMARVRREAGEGCALSNDFLRQVEPLFLLCQELRHEAPPVRTPEQERNRHSSRLSPELRQRLDRARRGGWRRFHQVNDQAPAEQDDFDA